MSSESTEHEPSAEHFLRDMWQRALSKSPHWIDKRSAVSTGDRERIKEKIAARKAGEKPVIDKTDGRRQRATGRTEQFNIKVKPEWREAIDGLASERGIARAELLERMLEEWLALGGKARA